MCPRSAVIKPSMETLTWLRGKRPEDWCRFRDLVQVCVPSPQTDGFRAARSWLLWLRVPGPSRLGHLFFHFSEVCCLAGPGETQIAGLRSAHQVETKTSKFLSDVSAAAARAGLKIRELAFPFGGGDRSEEEGQDFMLRVLL